MGPIHSGSVPQLLVVLELKEAFGFLSGAPIQGPLEESQKPATSETNICL